MPIIERGPLQNWMILLQLDVSACAYAANIAQAGPELNERGWLNCCR